MGDEMAAETKKQKTYKHQILELLPSILPQSPSDALTGTQLIVKLRQKGLKGSTDNSLHAWFSAFAKDPTTPIARVANGHGYFLRPELSGSFSSTGTETAQESAGRDFQAEEKFRALYLKWCESRGELPVLLNHNESAKKAAGLNKWKFPDVVTVRWDVLHDDDEGEFDENTLDVMRGLGEPPFDLISTELKVDLRAANLRESFFQCVSNSKWANVSQLVVAGPISDQSVVEELARLGSSYEVDVLSFGLSHEQFKSLPTADKIRAMSNKDADALLQNVTVAGIATGAASTPIDWEQLRDLQKQHRSINEILEWVAKCLKDKRPYSFDTWSKTFKKKIK